MAARDKKYEDFRGKLTVAGLELTPDGDLVNPLDGKVIDDIKGYRPFPYFRWRFQLPEEDHIFTGPPQVDRYGYCQVNKPRDFYKRITIRTRRLIFGHSQEDIENDLCPSHVHEEAFELHSTLFNSDYPVHDCSRFFRLHEKQGFIGHGVGANITGASKRG